MLWTTGLPTTLVYTASPPPPRAGELLAFHPSFLSYEAHLPAERTQAQAQARLSRAHGDARGPRDPQAPPRTGPEAPFRVTLVRCGRADSERVDRSVQTAARAKPARPEAGAASGALIVQRRNRLSRSRDFDAVYRQGRSTSTRFLVLYWFERGDDPGEPRLGLAVPRAAGNAVVRNRIKRQLREVWRARLEKLPGDRDYVLIVRPGLPEAVASNGFEWLEERVDEVLTKAAA